MRVIPKDPKLEALPALLSAARMGNFVRAAATNGECRDLDADRGELTFVRYRPTRDCVAMWSFPTARGKRISITAKLFADGAGASVAARSSVRRVLAAMPTADTGLSWTSRYLADPGLLLSVFPLDFRLPGLPLAGSAAWVRDNVLPAVGMAAADVLRVDVTPVAYRPWRRAVFRYEIEGRDGRRRYFAKVFRDDRGAPMLGRLTMIEAQLYAAGGAWAISAPVAYLADAHTLIMPAIEDAVKATRLMGEARKKTHTRARLLRHVAAAADGLRAFQRTELAGLTVVTPQDILQQFRGDVDSVRRVAPVLATSLARQLDRLEAGASRLVPEPMVPTHGAFRPGQLLLCPDRLVVFDLDTLCASGASADAGNFLAYLDHSALRRPRLRSLVDDCRGEFVEALSRSASDSGWLSWYRAASLIKLALRSFFSLAPEWPEATHGLVCGAERAWMGRPEERVDA
jgi:hypothetical protein